MEQAREPCSDGLLIKDLHVSDFCCAAIFCLVFADLKSCLVAYRARWNTFLCRMKAKTSQGRSGEIPYLTVCYALAMRISRGFGWISSTNAGQLCGFCNCELCNAILPSRCGRWFHRLLPSLGVSSLDFGPLFIERPFFCLEPQSRYRQRGPRQRRFGANGGRTEGARRAQGGAGYQQSGTWTGEVGNWRQAEPSFGGKTALYDRWNTAGKAGDQGRDLALKGIKVAGALQRSFVQVEAAIDLDLQRMEVF